MTARPYAEVIGDPIAHSKSPLIHNFWLAKLGIDAEYRATHIRAVDLSDYFARSRKDPAWRGCNVTVPHKQASLKLTDELDPVAKAVGAVNAVVTEGQRLVGWNTDVEGFREPLSKLADLPRSKHHVAELIEVIGAGGAARAVGFAFKGAEMTFFNRTKASADRLADEFSHGAEYGFSAGLDAMAQEPFVYDPRYPDLKDNRGDDQRYSYLIVNTSTMGMKGQPEVPINLDCYPPNTIVYDLVYAPVETGLIRAARERGMRTIDGLQMLVGQAAAAFELFFGQPAPRQHDAELRALLTS